MGIGSTRRDYLAAFGGVAALGAVHHLSAVASRTDCEKAEEIEARLEEKRSELEDKRAALQTVTSSIEDHQRSIMELHADSYEHPYDEATRQSALEVGKRMRESVVLQEFEYEHGRSFSTGWFVDEHHILTNAHNVNRPATKQIGQTHDGDTFEFEILGYVEDLSPDVALLQTDYSGTPLPTGDSESLSAEDPLVMVGHPGGFGFWVITFGPYESRYTAGDGHPKLRTGVPVLSGNSGSPAATLDGNVVGMINSSTGGVSDQYPDGDPKPVEPNVRYRLLAPDVTSELVTVETAVEKSEEWR